MALKQVKVWQWQCDVCGDPLENADGYRLNHGTKREALRALGPNADEELEGLKVNGHIFCNPCWAAGKDVPRARA